MWSRKNDKCVVCGTIDKRHKGNGMCGVCWSRNWEKINPESRIKRTKKWKEKNPERFKNIHNESVRNWRKKYPEKVKKICKNWRENHKDKSRELNKEWRKNNIEKERKNKKEYVLNRLHNDPRFKIKHYVSSLLRKRLHSRFSSKKGKSTFSFLPYTVDELKIYLENLFKPGMSWVNYGDWHIDHIKPDCKFDYKNVEDEEFQKCWALENLQPLWAEENLRKSNK